jgi:hypothetical protein
VAKTPFSAREKENPFYILYAIFAFSLTAKLSPKA